MTSDNTQQATDPIVVYGSPRSGTTYLEHILNEHPDVFISHEVCVFIWAHGALHKLTRDKMLFQTYREEFLAHLESNLREMIRDFYREQAPDRKYWGDKNPHYAAPENKGCLDTALQLFPNTRFLHIVRDGREVVASLLKKGWVDFTQAHSIWMKHADLGREFGQQLPANQYFELRYEDLIADDVAMATRIFEFLGIPFHDRVRSFCESQQTARAPLSVPTRDLRAGARVSQWANLLSREEQQRSVGILHEHLLRFGYDVPLGAPVPTVGDGIRAARSAVAAQQPERGPAG